MEDLFYFSKSRVTVQDVATLAKRAGYSYILVPSYPNSAELDLDIQYGGYTQSQKRIEATVGTMSVKDHWLWWKCDDFSDWEPSDLSVVNAYAPVSSFQVAYHTTSLAALASFMESVLNHYGGWVWGSDDRQYTADNIKDMAS